MEQEEDALHSRGSGESRDENGAPPGEDACGDTGQRDEQMPVVVIIDPSRSNLKCSRTQIAAVATTAAAAAETAAAESSEGKPQGLDIAGNGDIVVGGEGLEEAVSDGGTEGEPLLSPTVCFLATGALDNSSSDLTASQEGKGEEGSGSTGEDIAAAAVTLGEQQIDVVAGEDWENKGDVLVSTAAKAVAGGGPSVDLRKVRRNYPCTLFY